MKHFCYILILLFLWSCEQTLYVDPGYTLVFKDDFQGNSIDTTKWTFEEGTGCQYGINLEGWGNFEEQYYQAQNAKIVNNDYLQIEAKEEVVSFTHCNGSIQERNYTSARLNTKNKFDFTYGKIEASIKMDLSIGAWHAFWMLPSYPQVSWPVSGEIDIIELSYKDEQIFYSGTLHYSGPYLSNSYEVPAHSFFNDFHLYTLEWDRSSIKWYIDNELFHTVSRTTNTILDNNWPFNKEFHLILNTAVGGALGGEPSFNGQPQYMLVDYIKVYQKLINS